MKIMKKTIIYSVFNEKVQSDLKLIKFDDIHDYSVNYQVKFGMKLVTRKPIKIYTHKNYLIFKDKKYNITQNEFEMMLNTIVFLFRESSIDENTEQIIFNEIDSNLLDYFVDEV